MTTLNSGVYAYAIDAAGGTLAPLQGSPYPAGNGGFGVTATPNRRHLYVSNYGDGTLSAFDVASDGVLSPVGGPLSATPHPVFSAPTPNGRYLYVANDIANESDPGSVSGFAIDKDTGTLAPVPGSPVPASDTGPFGVSMAPDGKFVYVSNTGNSPSQDGSVSAYRIDDGTGAITEIKDSPYTVGIAAGGIAMTPDGKRLYVANGESATISGFKRDADSGALTPIPGSPFAAGTGEPAGVAITPDGRHLYTATSSESFPEDNKVRGFTIDPDSGALAPTSSGPYDAGAGPQYVAITGDGAHLYVTNNGSDDVNGYAIDASSGALTELGNSPFASGMHPLGITIPHEPSNEFSFGKLRKLKRKGKARLSLKLSGPGGVALGGKDVKKRGLHAGGDECRLLIAATGKKRRRLRRSGSSRLALKVSYTPDGGSAKTKDKRVRLIKRG